MNPEPIMRAEYNLIDQTVISAPPAQVWDALVAELSGAGRWWAQKNSFTPTHLRPDVDGGLTEMTVRPNGVGKPGPVLRFTAKTTHVVPQEFLRMDYVGGNFSGSGTFRLRAVAEGHTALSMDFRANPEGWLKLLARVKDVGEEHSLGAMAAFRELDRLLGDAPPAAGAGEVEGVTTWEGTVEADDGAQLRVVEKSPSGWDAAAGQADAAGSGTAVLVHGWGSRLDDWDAVASGLLRSGIKVVAMDLRGHGGSSRGAAPLTLQQLAADLRRVLAGRGVREAVLVGHSGGGLAALLLAVSASGLDSDLASLGTNGLDLRQPDAQALDQHHLDVQGLALLATAVHGQEVSGPELGLMGSSVFSRILRIPALAGRILPLTMGPAAPFAGRGRVAESLAATPPAVRRAYFELIRGVDLRDEASQLTLPVTILVGSEDRVVPPRVLREGARAFLSPLLIEVPGRGHALPIEAPDVVVGAVVEIFRERQANKPAGRYGSE